MLSVFPEKTGKEGRRLSWRDPAGQLFDHEGRLIRQVNAPAVPTVSQLLEHAFFQTAVASGRVISCRVLSDSSATPLLLEHPRVPFVSYAYEWPPEMLFAAAKLTLDLVQDGLEVGWGVKDATPSNVLFRATDPVFVDVLSFERRRPGDPTWLAFAQFVRNFLNPLLVNRVLRTPLSSIFQSHWDGLEPELVAEMAGPWRKWLPPFVTQATLPTLLSKKLQKNSPRAFEPRNTDPAKAKFVLSALLRHLRRTLDSQKPTPRRSFWAGYMGKGFPYEMEQLKRKEEFVWRSFERLPKQFELLDVGCNTGHFSRLAAKAGGRVVAIDSDPASVGESWREAHSAKLNILPLVVDIARPSPALGWCNAECESFLTRADQRFDMVLGLAVLHHLMLSNGIALADILSLFARMSRAFVLIEYIGQKDPSFMQLRRGRDHLYFTQQFFEQACAEKFDIVEVAEIAGSERALYLLRKKGSL